MNRGLLFCIEIMSGAADKSEIQKNLQTSSKESERESDVSKYPNNILIIS